MPWVFAGRSNNEGFPEIADGFRAVPFPLARFF
jgi:hypothetical protein